MVIIERMKSLIGVGTLGSVTIAAIGDFFAPKGGWLVTLVAGLASLVLLAYVVLCPPGKNALRRVTGDPAAPSDWWDGALWRQHGVHVLTIFTVVCLFVGYKSHAHAADGGVMGSHVGIVADAQQVTGLLEESVIEQRKARIGIENLTSVVKKETSSNPRVELMNLGVTWTSENFKYAIEAGDLETVRLFLEGGMPLVYIGQYGPFFKPGNEKMLSLLEQHPVALKNAVICMDGLKSIEELSLSQLKDLEKNDAAVSVIRSGCGPYAAEVESNLNRDIELWSSNNVSGTPAQIRESARYAVGRIAKLKVMQSIMGY